MCKINKAVLSVHYCRSAPSPSETEEAKGEEGKK